jgi:hypothetical protein
MGFIFLMRGKGHWVLKSSVSDEDPAVRRRLDATTIPDRDKLHRFLPEKTG